MDVTPIETRPPSGEPSALFAVVGARTAPAERLLEQNPVLARLAEEVAQVIQTARRAGAPFASVTLATEVDPELLGAEELVFDVETRSDNDGIIEWYKYIAGGLHTLNSRLMAEEKDLLAKSIGVHLHPGS